METKYFFGKHLRLVVKKENDELPLEVNFFSSGKKYEDAGSLIKSFGKDGKRLFWEKCISKEKFDELQAKFLYSQTVEFKELKAKRKAEKAKERLQEIENEYNDMISATDVIPSTIENIRILLKYLNTKNWGGWDLPKMTIGYSCNQYDCDGKIASTIKLDEPIDYYGEKETKFVVGAPSGHLTHYKRL